MIHSWLGALILGVIALLVGYNVAQPVPLNTIEVWGGWILIVLAVVWLIFGGFGAGGGWSYGRRYR
jgi:putative Ca2+/H+ antiporter (TMEM165/GDT1 family)